MSATRTKGELIENGGRLTAGHEILMEDGSMWVEQQEIGLFKNIGNVALYRAAIAQLEIETSEFDDETDDIEAYRYWEGLRYALSLLTGDHPATK